MIKKYAILSIILIVTAGLLTSFYLASGEKQQSENTDPLEFDNFELIEGLDITYLMERKTERWRLMQLCEDCENGRAEDYFFDASGKYDVTVYYVDGSSGTSSLEVLINNKNIDRILFGSSNSRMEKTIKGIDVQKWSRIELVFKGDGGGECRVYKLVFTPAGEYEGSFEDIEKPKIPRLFETAQERLEGRKILGDFVDSRVDSLMDGRLSELSGLKSPDEWRARQQQTREQLPEFFGEFPQKTPLNPRITGTLDRDRYTIENVIFESQPGYYVTANMYIPKGREFPVPGIIFTCGHSKAGKAERLYHEACLGMVLKGYAVLAFDPIGQGERLEYIHKKTGKNLFNSVGDQHMYFMFPAFSVDWSLSGHRVWDGIRAVDYLVSRLEVDQNRLGVVGNSGGGQMSFLIAAVDERIDVCVAAHPAGGDENVYLKGWGLPSKPLIDREILSLIAPRPCRIVVGRESGEELRHRRKYDDMRLFYEGLGYRDNVEFVLVDGVHNMRQPKREEAYEWFNKWFDKEEEGKAEPGLEPEKGENLRCTESGSTLISLGGETGRTLNVKRIERIYQPAKNEQALKENIAKRLGLIVPGDENKPSVRNLEQFTVEKIDIEKFLYESEQGIMIPSVLYKPGNANPDSPVYLYCSGKGKPGRFDHTNLPYLLAENGNIVLAIDVRGTGEISPTPLVVLDQSEFSEDSPANPKHHYILSNAHHVAATQSLSFGRTMTGMKTLDILQGIKLINSRADLKGRKIVLIGEGSAGVWTLLAAVFNPGVHGVATLGTVPSYKLFITNEYYNVWDYFWVPGLLRDFDIPDLAQLISPRAQVWIDPLNATGRNFDYSGASQVLGSAKNLHIETPGSTTAKDQLQILKSHFPLK